MIPSVSSVNTSRLHPQFPRLKAQARQYSEYHHIVKQYKQSCFFIWTRVSTNSSYMQQGVRKALTSDEYSPAIVWVPRAPPVLVTVVHRPRRGEGLLLFLEEGFRQASLGVLAVFPLLQSALQHHPVRVLVVPNLHAHLSSLTLRSSASFFPPLSGRIKRDYGECCTSRRLDSVGFSFKKPAPSSAAE